MGALTLALALAAAAGPEGAPEARRVVEPVFDAERGLAAGWMDYGWAPHRMEKGGPIAIDLSGYGGLILARPGIEGPFGGLAFRYRAPAAFGAFLDVHLEDAGGKVVSHVRPGPEHQAATADGWTEVFLPMAALDPLGQGFERLTFHAWQAVGRERVLIDRVGFTAPPPTRPSPPRAGRFALDCFAKGTPISPLIYGIGTYFADRSPHQFATGATARRWGGNPASRYNWEISAWNLNHDWFFRNVGVVTWQDFLDENRKHGLRSALTVPMLGWVAKDETSYSFPVSRFGKQEATAWDVPDAGNGVGPNGKPIPSPPPSTTSVPSTPESVERWVRAIRARDQKSGERSVHQYILDNEPAAWHYAHRDVHPEPETYDELLERTLAYAAAIRRADPEAVIAGPAEWGWLAYHYSGKDIAAGVRLRPDRRAHGDVPLIPWYLRKIREHEARTGQRVLDVLDVHFYSSAKGVGVGEQGKTDPATAALRIRTTRGLWDPTYHDESWIDEKLGVLPLLRRWVDEEHPGLGISLGEWSFGADHHISGGLATAEALGRFGLAGLHSAYYWTYPHDRTPAYWAFRAYRDFDGAGGRFQDLSVPVRAEASQASLFASRDQARRRVVAVLLNLDPASPLQAELELQGCGAVARARAFTYAGGPDGLAPLALRRGSGPVGATVAPSTITVVDLQLQP